MVSPFFIALAIREIFIRPSGGSPEGPDFENLDKQVINKANDRSFEGFISVF